MIAFVFLILLGLCAIHWNRIIFWVTYKRMTYRHTITSMKIEFLKALHEIGFF